EPYRRKLSFIWRRLGATLEGEPEGYRSAQSLEADLDLVDESLRAYQGHAVADGDLLRLRRQVGTFGFIGAQLDVRQHRSLLRSAADAVLLRIGGGREQLRPGILNPPPVALDASRWSPETGRLLTTFAAMAGAQRQAPGSAGTFIVSMTQSQDDNMAGLFLSELAGLHQADSATPRIQAYVVPLLARHRYLDEAPAMVDVPLDHPGHR